MRFLFACFLFLPQQWSMVFAQDVTWEIKNRFDPTDESDQSIHISIMRSQADGEASFTYSVKGKGGEDTAIGEGEKSDDVTLEDGVVGLVFNVVLQDDLHPEDDEVVVVTVKSKEGKVLAAETIIIRDNDRDSSNTTSSTTTTTTTTTTSPTSIPTTTTTTTKPLVSEEDSYAVVTAYNEISESGARLTIYLTRSPGTGTGTVTFSVRGGGGMNSAVEDESREISFGAIYIIPIDVSDDDIQEEDETLTISITEKGEVKATKIIIVKDDDMPTTTQPHTSTTLSSMMTSSSTSPSTSTSSTTTTTTTSTMPTSSPTTMPSSSSTTSYSTVFTSSSTMSTTTDEEYFTIDQPAVPLTESSKVITIKYEFKGKRPKDFTITVKGSKSGNPFSGVDDKTEIIHFRGTGTDPSQGGIEIKLNDDTVKEADDGFTITVTDENGKEWNKIFIPIKDND